MQLEMAAHIEQAAERFVARGMSEREAMRAAHREFGNVAAIQEEARDSRGGRAIAEFATDVRYALRFFRRTPLTSATIVFTLMLGIGLNAAVYSFVQGYLYNPPPGVPDNPSLVSLVGSERYRGFLQQRSFSYPELMDYSSLPVFASVAGWASSTAALNFGAQAEDVVASAVLYVTPNYFSTLGLSLSAGAGFVQSKFDDRQDAELTVILPHALALSQYGSPANAIGQKLRLNDVIVTVVGVAPRRFFGIEPTSGRRVLFMPMSALPIVEGVTASVFASPDSTIFRAVASVNADATPDQVQALVQSVATRTIAAQTPDSLRSKGTTVAPRLRGLIDVTIGQKQAMGVSAIFGTLDVLILLVCITTVSSLLVGSAVTRRHEIGVRLTLGASRWRIVRQLVTETSILALIGAAGGLAIYHFLTRLAFVARMPIDVRPSWDAVIFAAVFAVAIATLCGLSPALHATRRGLSDVLKDSSMGATSRTRLQRTFVVAQVAFAQPLLVVLGVNIASLLKESKLEADATLANNVIVVQYDAFASQNLVQRDVVIPAIKERLARVPGVAGVITRPNVIGYKTVRAIQSNGALAPSTPSKVRTNYVTKEYLDFLGIKLLAGRTFVPTDTSARVQPLLVRSDFAQKVFGGENPIGRRVCARNCTGEHDTLEIVGVVGAGWLALREREDELQALMPAADFWSGGLLVRTKANAKAIVPAIRSISRQEAPTLPINSINTIAELEAKDRERFVQLSSSTAGAGALTLFLACVGLYAVVALAVGQRKREIGIRIALGAHPTEVVSLFFRNGFRLSVLGLLLGLPLSAAGLKIVAAQSGKVDGDPVLISAAIALIVLFVACIATWLPARGAARVDPLTALRAE